MKQQLLEQQVKELEELLKKEVQLNVALKEIIKDKNSLIKLLRKRIDHMFFSFVVSTISWIALLLLVLFM